ncbi:hypothetical protein [Hymenobacter algoricola]|uniref:Lipoprotein n=1 Tax=Hymenobacter algoricola TaxID=486267 RepID=A0ABP7N9N0_9BACT
MKQLSTLRYLLFVLLFATASACGDDEKNSEPTPKAHTVQVRYSAVQVSGLGARISGASVNTDGLQPQNSFNVSVGTDVANVVQAVGQVTSDREFNVTLVFENVKTPNKAPTGSSFTADILVDGVVKKSVRIDNNTAPGVINVSARTSILTNEW